MILENLQYGNFVTDSIRIFDKRNTTGATSSAGTSYPFGAPSEFVEFMLLNLEFSEKHFVDHCLSFMYFFF